MKKLVVLIGAIMILPIVFAQPVINSVSDAPDPVEVPGYNNITADITGATEAYVEIYYPNSTLKGNYSMTNIPPTTWYYNGTYAYPNPLGVYTYIVKAYDGSDWVQSSSYTFTLQDTTLPSSNVSPIIPYWRSSLTLISATATDNYAVSNVSLWYRYSTDNSSWGAWTFFEKDEVAPWQWNFNFPDGEGYYEFYSIANDTAGNMESAPANADAIAGYRYGDTFPPIIFNISVNPPNQVKGGNVNISCIVIDEESGIRNVYLSLTYPSGAGYSNISMKNIGNLYYLNQTYTIVGKYDFKIIAIDRAGNWAISSVYHFNITSGPNNPPITTCIFTPSSPDGKNGWYIRNVDVTLNAIDPDGDEILYTKYRIDDGGWTNYSGKFTISDDGEHLIEFYSVDNRGGIENLKNATLKIDKSKPFLVLTKPLPGYLYLFDRQIIPLASGKTIIIGRIVVMAIAVDENSGIENVSFYVNGVLQSIDTLYPYEWIWHGWFGYAYLHVGAYNRAGLSEETKPLLVYMISL
ncbi:MAG: hypothetical protein QW519_01720 [Candidatus Thermoplasmatota archaeon]